MSYKISSKLTAILVLLSFLLISYSITKAAIGAGDGNILRRSVEETCHACHKTDQNARTDNDSLKTHSSEWNGSCSNVTYKNKTDCIANAGVWTAKWAANGGWGITGAKYGKFVCTTCHTAHDTTNIYLIKEKIAAPDNASTWPGGSNWTTVDFRVRSGVAGTTVGTMGDDNVSHTTSTKVCEACHSQTNYHRYDSTATPDKTHNNATVCSNCHSHKNAFSGGACNSCHGYPPANNSVGSPGLATPATGSTIAGVHTFHTQTFSFACTICHYNTSGGGAQHQNGKVTLGFTLINGTPDNGSKYDGQTTANYDSTGSWTSVSKTGTKSCSNIYCHGSSMSPNAALNTSWTWDNQSGTHTCGGLPGGSCHGGNSTNPPTKGSHQKHTAWATSGGLSLACTVCHSSHTEYNVHHVDGNADWGFDTTTYPYLAGSVYRGTASGQITPVPSVTYGQCSSVYCHGSGTPTWGGAALACNACHTASNVLQGKHAKHYGSATVATNKNAWNSSSGANYMFGCGTCHDTASVTHAGGTVSANQAAQVAFNTSIAGGGVYTADVSISGTDSGFKWTAGAAANACSSTYCHSAGDNLTGYSAPNNTAFQWATSSTVNCSGCHKGGVSYTTVNRIASGSHTKHVTGSNIDCTKCHNATASNSTTISETANHVNRLVNVAFDNTSNAGSATYNAVASPMTKNPGTAYGTCSSITCHGAGTPTWGGAVLACNACHTASNVLQGKHSIHYASATVATDRTAANNSTTGAYIYNCGVCHDPATVSHAGGSVGANQAAEIVFDAAVAGGGSYTAGAAVAGTDSGFKWTAGAASNACASTYCHSAGTTTTPPYAAPKNTTFQWATSNALTCAGCHGFDNASGQPVGSGMHSKHVNDYGSRFTCDKCHTATTNGSAITDKTKHLNKTKDVSFNAWGTGTYGSSSCNSVYCHSTGKGGYVAPTWTSLATGACGTCHGATAATPPATGKHAKHAGSAAVYQFKCYKCHTGTVDNNTTAGISANGYSAAHVNNSIDVAIETNAAGNPGGGSYVGSTCSTSYCHSSGKGTTVTTPSWTTGGTLVCNSCHGTGNAKGYPDYASGPAGSATANSHVKHADNVTGQNINCTSCHNSTTADGTSISSNAHVNGSINVVFSGGGSYNSGAKTCATTICHGGSSMPWGTVNSDATCVKCHGVAGTSPAAYTADNRTAAPGWNTTGRNTAGNVGTITNGVSNDSKVGAHDSHLRMFKGFSTTGGVQCKECHTQYTVASEANHMNGATNFNWGTLATNSANNNPKWSTVVLTPSYSGGYCATNYCHGGTAPAGVVGTGWTSILWTNSAYLDGTRANDCNRCHLTPPTRTTLYDHTWMTVGSDCTSCHAHNGTGGTHINGKLDESAPCNACHWYDTADAGAWTTTKSASGGLWNSTNAWGKHVKHINHLKSRWGSTLNASWNTFGGGHFNNVCGVCHTQLSANHKNSTRQVNFADGSGAHQFGSSLPGWDTISRSCSNLDCHYKATPGW